MIIFFVLVIQDMYCIICLGSVLQSKFTRAGVIFPYLDSLAVILIARVTLVISDNPGFSIHVHVKGWCWQCLAMTNTDECTGSREAHFTKDGKTIIQK